MAVAEPLVFTPLSARPTNIFGDYHADIVASLHKKGNTLQIRCASQNQRNTPAQSAAIVLKHSKMLKIGDVETQIDGVSRDTPLKSSKDVAKEAGVSSRPIGLLS